MAGRACATLACLLLVASWHLQGALAADNDNYCREAKIHVPEYADYFAPAIENGSPTGSAFTYGLGDMVQLGVAVAKISVWVGDSYMTGIEISLASGHHSMFGRAKGSGATYEFDPDETITYWHQWKSDGAKKVSGIKFATSKGGVFEKRSNKRNGVCSMGCSDCKLPYIGSGILGGIQGWVCSDADICQLSPMFLRTVVSQEMTNMTYPGLPAAPPPASQAIIDYTVNNSAPAVSTTKFSETITEKKSLAWGLTQSFKFGMMMSIKTSVTGEAPGIKATAEYTQQYNWEATYTTTSTFTTETSVSYYREFQFTCPADTMCRYLVSQGQGMLADQFTEFTAWYRIYLDSGVSLLYMVTGKVAVEEMTPYYQMVITEPISNSTALHSPTPQPPTSAAMAVPAAPVVTAATSANPVNGTDPAQRPFYRRTGSPALPVYVKCPLVNGKQLCTRRNRAPRAVVHMLSKRLMLSPHALYQSQRFLPFRQGHIVVNYAAPFFTPKLRG